MAEVAVLLLASVSMWRRPAGVPMWLPPALGALLVVTLGWLSFGEARAALDDVRAPLLFLVVAVPLAVALDDIGVFAAVAAVVDGGRHLVAWLWVLAAGVVVVFNLDAAVVLLTPLYCRLARRHGLDAEALALQPALLACLASGILPVSNLTNLIVAERFDLGASDFLVELAPPFLIATGVGYLAYRRACPTGGSLQTIDEPVDPTALRRGLPIVGFVLVGFTVGDAVGVEAWIVALAALAAASALTTRVRWREVPVEAITVAAGFVVLVAAASPHLALADWFGGTSANDQIRSVGVATLMSNLTNNLPTALAAVGSIDDPGDSWPILIGTNIGSVFLVTASLSTMLWRDTARRHGVVVSPWRWTRVALQVGTPALVAATVVRIAVSH
ncbi:MAG: hypothetical protein KDB37_21310 [Ilumatobacter sp.]|nr:hypothetical protein [Ilumatobacter sp.]